MYQRLIGVRPRLALVNEQAYSAGLVGLYLDAGYEALLMDWDNPSAHHPNGRENHAIDQNASKVATGAPSRFYGRIPLHSRSCNGSRMATSNSILILTIYVTSAAPILVLYVATRVTLKSSIFVRAAIKPRKRFPVKASGKSWSRLFPPSPKNPASNWSGHLRF